MNPVTLVVLTWNRLDRTQAFMASLAPTLAQPHVHLLVVDNGSTDGTVAWLREHCLGQLILHPENLGFTRGVNAALAQIPQDHDVVLLNNDLIIQSPDWVTRMQQVAYQHENIGVVGCRLTRPDGLLQHGGAIMPRDTWRGVQLGGGQRDLGQHVVNQPVPTVVFACAYLKRAVLSAVGHLDESFASYYEDTDYCLRASAQGFTNFLCGEVTHLHFENSSTEGDPEGFTRVYEQSRQTFMQKWADHLEAAKGDPFNWRSILHLPTGYAQTCRGMLGALVKRGLLPQYQYVYGSGTAVPFEEPDLQEDHPLVRQALGCEDKPTPVEVVYGMANVFGKAQGKHNIGFTMLEVDRFPKDWVTAANRMDEVWVPTAFHKAAFAQDGVDHVQVVPLGIDPALFNPHRTAFAPVDKKDFAFLSVFEWGERKAPELLLKTFNRSFSACDPVVLVAKIYNQDRSLDLYHELEKLDLDPHGGRIVPVINHLLPDWQMGSFYRSFDAFVFMSRGEGWGMPCLEAMACGLPVIASQFAGTTAFVHDAVALAVPPKELVPAVAKCPYYQGARWGQIDADAFADHMQWVVAHPTQARALGYAAADYVLKNFTWDHTAEVMAKRLADFGVAPEPLTLPTAETLK